MRKSVKSVQETSIDPFEKLDTNLLKMIKTNLTRSGIVWKEKD